MATRRGSFTFRATVYRHAAPHHAEIGSALLDASRRAGGRFNPEGEFGAVYLSLDRDTVRAELRRRADRSGIPLEDLIPRVLLRVHVQLRRVLDLRDREVRRSWGLDEGTITGADFGPCQAAGRAAREAGFEAILYPSAALPSGTNLVVFFDRLRPASELRVEAQEDLDVS